MSLAVLGKTLNKARVCRYWLPARKCPLMTQSGLDTTFLRRD
jgi:hypothetical protein